METKIKREKPAYQKIKEELKEDILLDKLENISESRVIRQFHVSNTTARRVLNELEEEGLLERRVGKGSIVVPFLEKKIKELGIIFFDIYDSAQPFISEIVRGIEDKTRQKNYHLHLYSTRNRPISESYDSSLYHLISTRKIDGFFLLSGLPVCDLIFFLKERIPFVVVGNNYPDIEVPTVSLNHKETIKEIGSKLIKLGYRKIGLITGPKGKDGIQRSGDFIFLGFQEFLEENRLIYKEELFKETEYSEGQGYQSMKEFYLLGQGYRPDAIIVASSPALKGVLNFIKEESDWQPLVLPYTDKEIDFSCYVFAPYKEVGETAFSLLENQMKDYSRKPETISVPLKIIVSEPMTADRLSNVTPVFGGRK